MSFRVLRGIVTPEHVKRNPGTIFVFGDNLIRKGRGGQAYACRDAPNAIGVATKHYPSNDEDSFFSDTEEEIEAVKKDLWKVNLAVARGQRVYWIAGIGEGLAELPTRSPKIFKMIQDFVASYSTP